jgi:transcriptional regulator with XRE-family HTH domain
MLKSDTDFYGPEESTEWLRVRMTKLDIASLEELAEMADIDRGTISRYFHHQRRPSIDALEPLCTALQVSPETLLKALGAIPK